MEHRPSDKGTVRIFFQDRSIRELKNVPRSAYSEAVNQWNQKGNVTIKLENGNERSYPGWKITDLQFDVD